MNKRIDMTAFAGTGFDCEFWDDYEDSPRPLIDLLSAIDTPDSLYPYKSNSHGWYAHCRPRLNKPQVLDDYRPVLVHGLVWNVRISIYGILGDVEYTHVITRKAVKSYIVQDEINHNDGLLKIEWLECIGATEEYADHARELGIPVIGGDE